MNSITLIENFRAAFYAPFYAAAALGAYDAEGLKVSIVKSSETAQTIPSLIAGDGQVSWGGPMRLMGALEKNPDCGLVAFCEVVGRDPFFILGRRPNDSFVLSDLKDVSFAPVSEVPTPWMCLQQDLRLAGIDTRGLRLREGRSMAENAEALCAGEVDAIQIFHPTAMSLVEEGAGHVWYAAATRGPTSYTTLNTSKRFIAGNSDSVIGMCRAMHWTQQWIARHTGKELATAVASYFPETPTSLLAACYEDYKRLRLWNDRPIVSRQGFEWLREAGLADGRLERRFSYEECVASDIAERVIAGSSR
ncbi:MAG: ABC transporter substrate-binding protein [Rhodospirillales bacterium]